MQDLKVLNAWAAKIDFNSKLNFFCKQKSSCFVYKTRMSADCIQLAKCSLFIDSVIKCRAQGKKLKSLIPSKAYLKLKVKITLLMLYEFQWNSNANMWHNEICTIKCNHAIFKENKAPQNFTSFESHFLRCQAKCWSSFCIASNQKNF